LKRARERSPVWSVKSILFLTLFSAALTAALVFGLGNRAPLVEAQRTIMALAGLLFLLLFGGLYYGVRLKDTALRAPTLNPDANVIKSAKQTADAVDPVDALDLGVQVSDEGGCLVALGLGIVIFLTVTLLAFFLESGLLVAMFAGIYWLFSRALRQVFIKGRVTRSNVALSFQYALWFTTLYSGWAIAFIYVLTRLRSGV
jgi:hypothetical protein